MNGFEQAADLARQTLVSICRNKLRSVLTLFGIAWGVASLVLLATLADGFRQGQRKNFEQIGDRIVLVFPGRTSLHAGGERAGKRIFFDELDVAAIRQQCPAVETVAGERKTWRVPVRSAFNSGQFLVVGATPEYLAIRNLAIGQGRHISAEDERQARRVAVLGHAVRTQLFEKRGNVLGETVQINGSPYLVVGLMAEKNQNSSYDGWDNDKIVVPASALRRDAPADRETYAQGRLNAIVYRPVSLEQWKEAQRQVRAALGRRHNFDPADERAVRMWDTVESAELVGAIFGSMEIFLSAVALVTLSLGGVGVMNTMMMAVSERTNEIGLKKALGATRRRILLDFFLEGMLLASAAGVAGLVLVLLLAAAVNALPLPAMFAGLPLRWGTFALATLALGAVAVAAALPPALAASRLTPVEALRHER